MTDPLTSPTFRVGKNVSAWPTMKVAHAASHFATLQRRVAVWAASRPFTTEARLREDRLGASWHLRVRTTAPTLEWSLYLGDCVHQLRSALDACVWDFATQNGFQPPRPNRVQFPIVRDADAWQSAVGDQLQGVPAEVVDRIKILEPFAQTPPAGEPHGLVLLQELSNLDKHRSSIIATVIPNQVNYEVALEFESDDAAGRNVPPDVTVHEPRLEDGALLAEHRTVDPIATIGGVWGMECRLSLEVTFGAPELFGTLANLINYVGTMLAVIYIGAVRENPEDEVPPTPS